MKANRILAILAAILLLAGMIPAAVAEETTIETNFWTLTYDSSVWVLEEDDLDDYSYYSAIELTIPDPEDEDDYIAYVMIDVTEGTPYGFRDYLVSYGFDQYEYAVNDAYDTVNVGGVDCLVQEGNYWGDPCIRYFNRIENAGITVMIQAVGDYSDERIAALLEGLTVKVVDKGNVDGPWEWEGTPFSAEDASVMVGTYTVNSHWIPFAEPVTTRETFDHAIALCGDTAYVLHDGAMKQYAYDGESMTYVGDVELESEFTMMQPGADGSVWISDFMEPLINLRDGAPVARFDSDTDYVAMAPDGTWGVSYFTSAECEKITIENGVLSRTAIVFPEVDIIMHLVVDSNYIYVCGSAVDGTGHKVFMYNPDGELLMTLADPAGEGMGSITFMAETENGFIGLDGNMREILLWNKDGQCIGAIEDSDLFGTSYPWFCGGQRLPDGSILVIMTEERADRSADEVILFRLSGF